MKRFSVSTFACTLAIAALSFTGCKKDKEVLPTTPTGPTTQTGTLDIELDQRVGNTPLVLATQTYTTPTGDQFRVTKFNYYLSNIKLTRADGSEYVQPESYYLVEAEDNATHRLAIKDIPVGDYTGITFTIGVDSARNVSGAQKGALDPNEGMFWSWNFGYIFTKLEGFSPQAPTGAFTYHIGGFKKPYDAVRTVSPAFRNGAKLLIRTDHAPEIHMTVDVLKMLTGATTVRFATFATSHSAGPNAMLLANNYAQGMFVVDHIHAN
ncbi:MbnP family protein [Hymenobacter terrenus]|uniref:MbnP family protein n=1 Tax=Hymenobacter terrenus TaxID=1629124 RepID=UPI000619E3C2|nr:MbnP family protein [Hymenobacter terrenus]